MIGGARVALVVAVARNGVIGRGGDLAWRISDDLKWFKKVTLGKPVVMGRKTWDSIGRPLPGRTNIVVTRRTGFAAPGAAAVGSVDAALALAAEAAERDGVDEICVIGGGEIYRAALACADRIYWTDVDAAPEGDVWFPEIDPAAWRRTVAGAAEKGPKNEHSCTFFILDRRQTEVVCP